MSASASKSTIPPEPLDPLDPLGQPDPTIKKASEMLGVSDRSVRRLIERGEVEAYDLFGTRIKLESLRRYVEQRRSVPLKLLQPIGPGEARRPVGRPRKYASAG
jgi:excisionase family DNA binding protein